MNFEISNAAEMFAAAHPLAADLDFLRGATLALTSLDTTDEARVLAFAQGWHAATLAAQAEAAAQPAPDAQADAEAIRQAERERIAAICALPEAKGREASALHLATTTDIAAAQVAPLLKTVAAAQPASAMPAPKRPPLRSLPPGALRARDAKGGLVTFDDLQAQAADNGDAVA